MPLLASMYALLLIKSCLPMLVGSSIHYGRDDQTSSLRLARRIVQKVGEVVPGKKSKQNDPSKAKKQSRSGKRKNTKQRSKVHPKMSKGRKCKRKSKQKNEQRTSASSKYPLCTCPPTVASTVASYVASPMIPTRRSTPHLSKCGRQPTVL